ncbi:fasciclin domain-containing protein [Sphingomonas faeni]|uniref:fasciclin domain-containing protein n=1 Tax=Sphingomonas faeni TaxID=185950 RepID=UPI0020BDC60C|nr:fasciclin domain-containing protein [Sphingomonas faeni]MCK8457282.1 fasciclin domain-containing protein [Sphingomonas faeni]
MTVKTNLLIAAASSMILAAGATAQTTTPAAPAAPAAPAQTAPATTATPQAAPATAAPAAPTAAPTTTIAAALPTLPNRATLTKLVTAAKLQTTLAGPGPFTVFAPSDEAFTRLPPGALDTLLKPESAPTLATILKYHVVAGAVTSDQLKAQITAGGGKATLTTLAGQPLIASIGPNGNIELTDTAGIKSYVDTADIRETNGVVHLTNGMSVPKLG